MVMTIAKITAGDGYTYLTRHTAHGDADPAREADAGHGTDAAGYYTEQGNPPGRWTGRGAPLLGLAGREVTEEQMRALFGHGEHPDSEAIIVNYLTANVRAGMTGRQLEAARDAAITAARLGNPFPAYKPLEKFDARMQARLSVIREETGREPSEAEVKKVKAVEARCDADRLSRCRRRPDHRARHRPGRHGYPTAPVLDERTRPATGRPGPCLRVAPPRRRDRRLP
jgi:hypothetical protein